MPVSYQMRSCIRLFDRGAIMSSFNEYVAVIETEGDGELHREYVEYNALSSSEAQAYAFDDLADSQRVVSIWQRVL